MNTMYKPEFDSGSNQTQSLKWVHILFFCFVAIISSLIFRYCSAPVVLDSSFLKDGQYIYQNDTFSNNTNYSFMSSITHKKLQMAQIFEESEVTSAIYHMNRGDRYLGEHVFNYTVYMKPVQMTSDKNNIIVSFYIDGKAVDGFYMTDISTLSKILSYIRSENKLHPDVNLILQQELKKKEQQEINAKNIAPPLPKTSDYFP